MLYGRPAMQSKNKKATYLQSQCTNNQRFFGNSEEAEFFAAFLLVFSIFFRNFKSEFSESYKTKRINVLKIYATWAPGNAKQKP